MDTYFPFAAWNRYQRSLTPEPSPKLPWWPFILAALLALLGVVKLAHAAELTASWYSVESSRQEGSSGIMANGRKLDDSKLTCASWDYPLGTKLKVCNQRNKKCILTVVSDRGPSKKLYRKGRIIDLSKKSFSSLADLSKGVIDITIEIISS